MDVDYRKLDPGLAGALSDPPQHPQDKLAVSVRTVGPLTPAHEAEMKSLGVQGVGSGLGVYSATVDRSVVAVLSHKPWVKLMSLARRLNYSG